MQRPVMLSQDLVHSTSNMMLAIRDKPGWVITQACTEERETERERKRERKTETETETETERKRQHKPYRKCKSLCDAKSTDVGGLKELLYVLYLHVSAQQA